MTTNDHQQTTDSAYVFRVLSGSLNGIEFTLGAQDHFICTNDDIGKQENLSFAERTLFIPAAKPGNNFILNLGNQTDDAEFGVTICYPDRQETQRLKFNAMHRIEGVAFAIRSDADMWSEQVLHGLQPAPAESGQINVDLQPVQPVGQVKKRKSILGWVACAVVAICTGAVLFEWESKPFKSVIGLASKNESDVIGKIVASQPGFLAVDGRNDVNYLFASTPQQFDWANQLVNRKNLAAQWKVVTPQSEEIRLAKILERNNIAFFTVRFNDPGNPSLVMSSTRNEISKENLDFIRQLLKNALPYAKDIHIVLEEDAEVLNRAQQGLRALGFRYETLQSEAGVTLSSWMPSVDVHLTEFSRFVTQFYETWGKRYVHFSADIRDDLLKEKSFKYGEDGYVTMNKSHWLFNKKVE